MKRLVVVTALMAALTAFALLAGGCGSDPDGATGPGGEVPVDQFGNAMTGGGAGDFGNSGMGTPPVPGTPIPKDVYECGPGAFDFPGNGQDEDCDGADDGVDPCDQGLAIEGMDPADGARAIGLCKFTSEESGEWGVISATWTQADGTPMIPNPMQKGILPNFGVVQPRLGASMLALSSGAARSPEQTGYTSGCDTYTFINFMNIMNQPPPDPMNPFDAFSNLSGYLAPEGYPKEAPACPGTFSGPVFDPAALELRIRVPNNVGSFTFDSNFYTYEYPQYICSPFNDYFVAILDPKPAELPDGNIVFDQDGNSVSVNNSLLQVCQPGTHGGKTFECPLGDGLLGGTSFDGGSECASSMPDMGGGGFPGFPGGGADPAPAPAPVAGASNAATGWLVTSAPAAPATIITLRFAVWDSGDPILDSLALIDNFQWTEGTPKVVTVPIRPD